jgi:hypothetical protein
LRIIRAQPADLVGISGGGYPFIFEQHVGKSLQQRVGVTINRQNEQVHEALRDVLGPSIGFFGSFSQYSELDNVSWFTRISSINLEHLINEEASTYFPGVRSISLLSPGGIQMLYGDIGHKKLPLSLISSGLHKVVTLILASAYYFDGVIIIDEVENGIWHEKYETLWRLLCKICRNNNNQLFVSSHSLECLRALAPIVSETPTDFSLIRARRGESELELEYVEGAAFAAAISGNVEVR